MASATVTYYGTTLEIDGAAIEVQNGGDYVEWGMDSLTDGIYPVLDGINSETDLDHCYYYCILLPSPSGNNYKIISTIPETCKLYLIPLDDRYSFSGGISTLDKIVFSTSNLTEITSSDFNDMNTTLDNFFAKYEEEPRVSLSYVMLAIENSTSFASATLQAVSKSSSSTTYGFHKMKLNADAVSVDFGEDIATSLYSGLTLKDNYSYILLPIPTENIDYKIVSNLNNITVYGIDESVIFDLYYNSIEEIIKQRDAETISSTDYDNASIKIRDFYTTYKTDGIHADYVLIAAAPTLGTDFTLQIIETTTPEPDIGYTYTTDNGEEVTVDSLSDLDTAAQGAIETFSITISDTADITNVCNHIADLKATNIRPTTLTVNGQQILNVPSLTSMLDNQYKLTNLIMNPNTFANSIYPNTTTRMFAECSNITDLSTISFNNIAILEGSEMFAQDVKMKKAPIMTVNVESGQLGHFENMFINCSNLTDLNISFEGQGGYYLQGIFNGCVNLSNQSLLNIAKGLPNRKQIK